VAAERLAAFYDFVNRESLFDGVASLMRFAITSMTGGERVQAARFAFLLLRAADVPAMRFSLAAEEVLLLNPNTGTLPVFRSRRDAEVALACHRRCPVLVRDGGRNPWGLRFGTMFHMANDSGLFRTDEDLSGLGATFDGWAWSLGKRHFLPLYEAKMLHLYHHRFGTYAGYAITDGTGIRAIPTPSDQSLDNPNTEVLSRYWVEQADVDGSIPARWDRRWLFGWRDITYAEHVRTFLPCVLPQAAVNHKFPIALPADPAAAPLLQAVWSSLAFDYLSRQKLSGTSMIYAVVKQLACPEPAAFEAVPAWSDVTLAAFVRPRVLELAYTSHRLAPYAVDVLQGVPGQADPGPPFRWQPERREQLRAELDAAMLHLYGLSSSDAEHVLDSFFVLRKYEMRDSGEFRTKRLVLAAYDAMTAAADTGAPYTSPLDPLPGSGPRHPSRSR